SGKRFNSPNDVIVKSDGTLWFSDPTYGIDGDYEGDAAPSQIGASHVYRYDPASGASHAGTSELAKPNCPASSPAENPPSVSDRAFGLEMEWPSSEEFKQTAEAIRKSGKAKFVGFSTHHPQRHLLLQAAAKGGFVDVIMLMNNPWSAGEDDMNRALDACYKRGI